MSDQRCGDWFDDALAVMREVPTCDVRFPATGVHVTGARGRTYCSPIVHERRQCACFADGGFVAEREGAEREAVAAWLASFDDD